MFSASEIAAVCKGVIIGKADARAQRVSTDSRRITQGDLFFALKGERFDGNMYAEGAFASGAQICVTGRQIEVPEGKAAIAVENTGDALLRLAGHYRSRFDIKMTAVTGSVGKTTTKEMIACALETQLCVLKTKGNLNNEIGLPLTLFELRGTHEAAVVEMGMSSLGEISRLTRAARPDIAVITNIGMSHIGSLKSVENILKAKLEILEGLSADGTVILNGDDPMLARLSDLGFRKVLYGFGENCDVRAVPESEKSARILGQLVTLQTEGKHNLQNACAAMAVAAEYGISPESAAKGISGFTPDGQRQTEVKSPKGFTLICDYYNASPQSVEAALSGLSKKQGRKIAVLGDMLELGEYSRESHEQIGEKAAAYGIDCLLTVGDESVYTHESAARSGIPHTRHFASKKELSDYLNAFVRRGDYVLIKGSRGMKMEEILR